MADHPWLLVVNAAAAWFMAGLIWFVQVVHYPLFGRVGAAGESHWKTYELEHQRRTTLVVAPAMLVELAATAAVLWFALGAGAATGDGGAPRPAVASAVWLAWLSAGLLAVAWVSTFFVQVPRHERLGQGFDARVHRQLVVTNWVRTFAWSARAVICALLLRA